MKWHYTSEVRLAQILHTGVLMPNSYEGERSAVWFSSNQFWEQTACKRINFMQRRLTFEEQVALIGCARVGVELETLIPYLRWSLEMPKEFAVSLALGGIELGANPGEWYASFEPVSNQDWRSIQVWRMGRWMNLEEL